MMAGTTITLNGHDMTVADVAAIAAGARVIPDPSGLARMAATHAILREAAARGTPVYGVTTGLGPRVGAALEGDAVNDFALNTVRGRAHAIGPPLSRSIVRAAMAIRLNSLLIGASGASPPVAEHIAGCLNAGLTPHIGSTISTGAADLMWGATMGLALIGEGSFLESPPGETSILALERAGLSPPTLGPRDGLALASHSSFTAAIATLGLDQGLAIWDAAQTAAALSLEAFRGNLSPLDPGMLVFKNQPGLEHTCLDLNRRLEGSALYAPGSARRLQDPLSLRNLLQVNASVYAALKNLEQVVLGEINGVSDNPVVLLDRREILSGGGYLNPGISVTLVAANHAFVHLAAQVAARSMRLLANRFTDLPNGLTSEAANVAGLGPLTKLSEALFSEVSHKAVPPIVYPALSADGVEDSITNASLAGHAMIDICDCLSRLIAIEMIIAVQAIELRGTAAGLAPPLRPAFAAVRSVSERVSSDRPMSRDIEALSERVRAGLP